MDHIHIPMSQHIGCRHLPCKYSILNHLLLVSQYRYIQYQTILAMSFPFPRKLEISAQCKKTIDNTLGTSCCLSASHELNQLLYRIGQEPSILKVSVSVLVVSIILVSYHPSLEPTTWHKFQKVFLGSWVGVQDFCLQNSTVYSMVSELSHIRTLYKLTIPRKSCFVR